MNENHIATTETDAALAEKYRVLRDLMLTRHTRHSRYYRIGQLAVAVGFTVLSVLLALLGAATGRPMPPLIIWIVLLFLIVFVFVILERRMHVMETKIIPFLTDDAQATLDLYDPWEDDGEEEEPEEEEDS